MKQGLFRVRPLMLFGNRRYAEARGVRYLNACLLNAHVGGACRRLGFRRPVVWGHFSKRLAGGGRLPGPLLYEVVDDVRIFSFPGLTAEDLVGAEREIVRRASWVVATARRLCERVTSEYGVPCHYVPNAVEAEHFRRALEPGEPPEDLVDIPAPRVGYVGAVGHWLDADLIVEVARQRPAVSFVFVGPLADEKVADRLRQCANVHLLGSREYAELPRYLGHFEVCTIPFAVNEMTHAVSPLKFFEYVAADRPVVAAPLAELSGYGEIVRFADEAGSFAREIDASLGEPRAARSEARRRVAEANSWEARCQQILDIVLGRDRAEAGGGWPGR